ncbi:formate-dependent phosphoribosylglycinamide formyltransferase [Nanchangia anserum]|uniref:Formate-dependent phosphoribosylglycinamide formyltransferase n=1 Tax=Nanchangia anserum TaxID=2692125 RepID=A0A8I0GD18_9ACTO|nr:formate-dependent phosphoribosylglycinamide formyltransferase [Nanchangia anserum]MBD3689313.1 formate-dependent phosphoribosylglycinamide formyltransferase [Nanchangia anserum]QOX81527.1 formate-dependent phosphoribosylglycinamide formyltransferase [Nanchangia anserum]
MFTPSHLGTALTDSALRVLLLGSGELGKEVTIALQRLGVEVHAADRYANAPAHAVAHRAYCLDMTDTRELRELVETVRPHLVVPEIEALATETLAELDAAGVTSVVPTPRAVQLTMNREGIRRLAAEELGLETSPYRFASSLEELREGIAAVGLPAVVKPVMSSSGHGQSLVRSLDEAEAAWRTACEGGRVATTRVIVEGFVDFDYEITLLTVRSLDPATGEVRTDTCAPIGHRQVDGDYVESWQPAPMSEAALASARDVATRVVDALGGRGIFGVELFICGERAIFSEVSPRPHDTGMVTMASQRYSEFDLHARAILGLPVDVRLDQPGASAVVKAPSDVVSGAPIYEGLSEALAVDEVDVRIFGKPEAHPGRRLGVALARAESIEEARERAGEAARRIRVRSKGETADA